MKSCNSLGVLTSSMYIHYFYYYNYLSILNSVQDIQQLLDRLAGAANWFSPKTNIKKIECVYQPIKNSHPFPKPQIIMTNQKLLVQATDFTYIGIIVSNTAWKDREGRNWFSKIFWKASAEVVEQQSCYGIKPPIQNWKLDKMQRTHKETKHLCDETTERHKHQCMADILIERNQRWIGYVHRIEEDQLLPKHLLYS